MTLGLREWPMGSDHRVLVLTGDIFESFETRRGKQEGVGGRKALGRKSAAVENEGAIIQLLHQLWQARATEVIFDHEQWLVLADGFDASPHDITLGSLDVSFDEPG